jgi:hypothetical protein
MDHTITHVDGTEQDIACDKVALGPVIASLIHTALNSHLEVSNKYSA